MPKPKQVLDPYARREVAEAMWRLFCLVADRVTMSFDQEGVTIRVPFKEEMDLGDGNSFIYGITTDYKNYTEHGVKGRHEGDEEGT